MRLCVSSKYYAGTNGGGLSIFLDGGLTFSQKTIANGLGSDDVRSIYVSGQNIYVGTDGGLSISVDGGLTFTNKTTADGLGSKKVNSVYVSGRDIYVGTDGGFQINW